MAASCLTQHLHLAALTGAAFIPEQGDQSGLTWGLGGVGADMPDLHGIALALAREAVAGDADQDDQIGLT